MNSVTWCQDGSLMTKTNQTTPFSCSSQIRSFRWWRRSGARANLPADHTWWLVATCRRTLPRNTTSACRSILALMYSSSWGRRPANTIKTARRRPRRKVRRQRMDLERRAKMTATTNESLRRQPAWCTSPIPLVTAAMLRSLDTQCPKKRNPSFNFTITSQMYIDFNHFYSYNKKCSLWRIKVKLCLPWCLFAFIL